MKRIVSASLIVVIACSFSGKKTLTGAWEYLGGIYNGRQEKAPADYKMQRKYDSQHFNAFALQKGYKPEKYESGDYTIKGDTCVEIQTYSSEPSKMTGIPVHYRFELRLDSLILTGKLPTGMAVVEYWKRVR